MRATRALIDLGALRHNLQRVRQSAPQARVMAAVKANGYGHGLLRVAQALTEADAFGVASLEEALVLREGGITQPIMLLEGFFTADELPLLAEHRLQALIHHSHQIEQLEQAGLKQPVEAWLKVDTGMHRLGIPADQAQASWQRLVACQSVDKVLGCMTHLANADDLEDPTTTEQLQRFAQATEGLPGARAIANSAGILGWPASHADWVRPGIMLYGASPLNGRMGADDDLKPVMTLSAELIAVNQLQAGDPVGYGGTWSCPEAMPVGVVSIGYGDGYPRHAPNGTPVLVNGRLVPLIGRVSMDMITVDLRGQPQARVGDPVTLWGAGLPVERVAKAAGTISYELFCGITQRVPFDTRD